MPPEDHNTASRDANPGDEQTNKTFSIDRHVMFGTVVISILFLAVGGWGATAELSGAVIAPGTIVVDKNLKKLQHRDGGIVKKIHVRNGDRVEAGQVLVELDSTQIDAELGIVRAQMTELTARKARLTAEVNGDAEIDFPDGFVETSKQTRQVALGEKSLFTRNRANIKSQQEQLELQIQQLDEEIAGIEAQQKSKDVQLKLIDKEIEQVNFLLKKKLTSLSRYYSMLREAERLRGELGGLSAQKARAKGRISEIRIQILSTDQNAQLQAQKEVRTVEAKLAELFERNIAAEDRHKRAKLHAPQSGIVHELALHTVGGVVTAAETMLVIVPNDEKLMIEARFAPADIDQVVVGRMVELRFSAFNQAETPELEGRVVHVSADVSTDERSSQQYYLGRVEISPSSWGYLKKLKLLPGMPVEVFVSTGARTALSYLLKPVTDQVHRTFREE